tara:strand:+ start:406 stop:672 length:267 start_codon:yes stop_codon:yes gene_type:complete
MAQLIGVYVYGIDSAGGQTEIAAPGGQYNLLPSLGVHVYPTTQSRGQANVACKSVIELLPTGLNQVSTKFFTAKTVAEVLSLANAPLA